MTDAEKAVPAAAESAPFETALRDLVREVGAHVVSAAAAPPSCLEARALRASWLRAIAVLGTTEQQALEASRGAYLRGKDACQNSSETAVLEAALKYAALKYFEILEKSLTPHGQRISEELDSALDALAEAAIDYAAEKAEEEARS